MAAATKVRYYERASIFDRFLILLLSLSCAFLINLVARSSYGPCAESLRLIKQMRADQSAALQQLQEAKEDAAAKEDALVATSFFSSKFDASSSASNKQTVLSETGSPVKTKEQKRGILSDSNAVAQSKEKKDNDESQVKATKREELRNIQMSGFKTPKVVQPINAKKRSSKKVAKAANVSVVSSSTGTLWKNKYGVVHVLWTRFMQLQPNLIHLGRARLELFKTFTLRSYREQSTQEFLWIIFTDPELDPVLRNDLVDLVKVHKNILLVGMNVGFKDFRNPDWVGAIEDVFSGDLQMLRDYQAAAQDHVYVESRIDADDSMFQEFMQRVQSQAAKTLGMSAKDAKYNMNELGRKPEFLVFCPEHHLEWGYFNPWQPESTKGHLFGVTAPEYCITAGLTYAFQVGTSSEFFKIAHHQLDKTYPRCSNHTNKANCIERIDAGKYKYVMLRSRTPTSAGMAGVIPTLAVTRSKQWAGMQDEAWNSYIFQNFGITPRSIWDLRAYLTNDMEGILQDALAGQCTRADFTCKKTSRDNLTHLLEEVRRNSGGAGIKSGVASNQTTDTATGRKK